MTKKLDTKAQVKLQRLIQRSMAGVRVALEEAYIAGLDRAEEIRREVMREQITKGGCR